MVCNEDIHVHSHRDQEQITEKESIISQYEHIVRQKAIVNESQAPLVAESDQLRIQIAEFSDKQQAITVCLTYGITLAKRLNCVKQAKLTAAVTSRMRDDQAIEHYKAKAEAERQKLTVAEKTAEDVQEEFKVIG